MRADLRADPPGHLPIGGAGAAEPGKRPAPRDLISAFAATVRRHRHRPAVIDGDRTLTYEQLDREANRVGAWLRGHGFRPGDAVGVLMPKSADLLVAVIGIVKAGGAYVPIDIDFPPERIAHMITDSGMRHLMVRASTLDRVPTTQVALDYLDLESDELTRWPDTAAAIKAAPDDVACIFYTSGSTGKPKGALCAHESVVALGLNPDVPVDPSWCVGLAAAISFDGATFEIWSGWLNGARLLVLPKHVLVDAEAFERAVQTHQIKVSLFTTSLFHQHAHRRPGAFGGMAAVLVGGEQLDSRACARVMRSATPPGSILNAYGPTECTTFSALYSVPRDWGTDPAHLDVVLPIGLPTKGDTMIVVDAALKPVPVGEEGELCIGGIGVAMGYLNRPDLNGERFLADPWSPGGRLYRTGDRARLRADGIYEYLGRIDQQVKVRGTRIEPGEIESELCKLPGIRQAAVVAQAQPAGDPRLVAYLVWEPGAAPAAPRVLRDALARALVPAMIPTAFVPVAAFPLTVNGKLDKRALPVPTPAQSIGGGGDDVEPPADDLERTLLSIWCALLGLDQIGVNEDFMAVGGHSLMAVQLLDRIEHEIGRPIRLSDLLDANTIRKQAAVLRGSASASGCAVAINPNGDRPPLFMITGWGGPILPIKSISNQLGARQPVYLLDTEVLAVTGEATSIEAVARRLIADIRRVQPHGPYHFAGYSLGGCVAYELAQQLGAAGETTQLLVVMDAFAPGFPTHAPLPTRLMLHLGRALAGGRKGFVPYLQQHLPRMKRFVATVEPRLFPAELIPQRGSASKRMERAAAAMLRAWQNYRPKPYDGTLTIIRAHDISEFGITARDEPFMGWRTLVRDVIQGGGVDCVHSQLLNFEHTTEVSDLLSAALARAQSRAGR